MTNQITVERLTPITHNSVPVITTELLAQLYATEVINIQVNHTRNRDRFVEGKHYFKLEGVELKELKNRLTESKSVAKRTRSLILWTERGAARHAKMLETDQAWEVFETLEDCYFNKKEPSPTPRPEVKTHTLTLTDKELCNLCWLWSAADAMRETVATLYPAVEALGSPLAAKVYSMGFEFKHTLELARKTLERETKFLELHPHRPVDDNWRRVLPRLRLSA